MRRITSQAIARVLPAACLLILVACGNGVGGGGPGGLGGGEPPSAALLSGTYGYEAFSAMVIGTSDCRTCWGQLVSAGDGESTIDLTCLDGPGIDTASIDRLYDVATDRSLTLSSEFQPLSTGRISESGHLASTASHQLGLRPGISLCLRRRTGYADVDLMGSYRGCSIQYLDDQDFTRATVGYYTFNGAGGWSGSFTANLEGVIGTSQVHEPSNYSVLSSGETQLVFEHGFTLRGHLSSDNGVLCVAGGDANGANHQFAVFLRETQWKSDINVNGTYAIIGITFDYRAAARAWASVFGTFTGDGAGGYTATYQRNEETTILDPETDEGTYSVTSPGAITITNGQGHVFEGQISPDYSLIVYAGGTTNLSYPSLYILVR